MLGSIEKIIDNKVFIKLAFDPKNAKSLLNLYVFITDNENSFIGEIIDIDKSNAVIMLLGEYKDNDFTYGIIKKPSLSAKIDLISSDSIAKLISYPLDNKESINIAQNPFYDDLKVYANVNNLFGSHLAIFGSTGSGKSCAFSRIIQNLMAKENISNKMNLIIFDAYGEYIPAFDYLNNSKYAFKVYTTENNSSLDKLCIPPWFLDVDDYALLLNVTKKEQIPIIEKALRNVNLFKANNEEALKYKNSILASALLEILLSGRPAPQIRDQIFSCLSKFNTNELNLESKIYWPGYTRSLRQCLLIDEHNKINAIELIAEFLQKFVSHDEFEISMPDGTYPFSLEDFADGLDFALIDEGIWKSDKIFDDANILKVRLNNLISSDNKNYFNYPNYITKEQYLANLLYKDGKKAQIINFNINYLDDRFAKTIVKIYSKLFFNYAKDLKDRASFPFNIILEEAHRYVQNDIDNEILGYNIFERISKEGRKYGVLLTLISQRPCELSETSLSQCANFLLFKMTHPDDLEYVRKSIPFISEETLERIKVIKPGYAICFGSAFKMPSTVKMVMPNPAPNSDNCQISSIWFE